MASLIAEQKDLEHQLNHVNDDDLFLEKHISPIDLSRDDNDCESEGKSRTRYTHIYEYYHSHPHFPDSFLKTRERQDIVNGKHSDISIIFMCITT